MEESLVALLIDDAAIQSYAGYPSTRVYWVRAVQNVAKPYAVLTRIGKNPEIEMMGISDLSSQRVQVDCYGSTYAETKLLSRAIEDKLNGYKGGGSIGFFEGIFLEDEREGDDATSTSDRLFRVSLDFTIWYRRP